MATETVSLLVLSRHGSTQELAGLGLGPLGTETGNQGNGATICKVP